MQGRNWKTHISTMVLFLLLLGLIAGLSGHWQLVIITGLLIYLGWTSYNVFQLHRWLNSDREEPPESIGVWADIFDRIDALEKSKAQRRQNYLDVIAEFQSMTNAFPDASLVIDENDCITWFNDAAHQLLGLKAPEDLGQPVTNLLRGPDFGNWVAIEDQVEGQFEMDSPLDSRIRLNISGVRYRDGQRLLILRDVSRIYNLEKVRRDFVANVSHELRTPLTVLLGYLESVQDDCPDDLAPAVDRMQEQARQMQALLTDLLELSRLQAEQQESPEGPVDVPGLLMQIKEQAEELSQGSHRLIFDIDTELQLKGVSADLESAFRNLINNAIHYTPDEGTISVSWQQGTDGPLFSVSDTGIGIPHRDLPRLTERFYRVGSDRSRHSGGTGLGLAIVKHVMNAHDAHLTIESELGEGSTFSCVFPGKRMQLSSQLPDRATA